MTIIALEVGSVATLATGVGFPISITLAATERKVEHYRKMKEEILARTKKATEAIPAEQREEILK